MTSNLVARVSIRERSADVDLLAPPPDPYLHDVLTHGDQKTIGMRLGLGATRISNMANGSVRSPFLASEIVIDSLRANRNPGALVPLFRLARKVGCVAYELNAPSVDTINFADALREIADLIGTIAEAERDGKITQPERLAIVKDCDEAIERLVQYRDRQKAAAEVVR